MLTNQLPFNNRSDNELIESCKKGDDSAFAEIFTRYKSKLLIWTMRLISCDKYTAEDIVQDTFIKVFLKINQYKGDGFSAWIYRINANNAFYSLRKKTGRPYDLIENYNIVNFENPLFILEYKQKEEAIVGAWESLSEDEKLLIALRSKNLGFKEISKFTGLTRNSTSNKLKTIIGKINKAVESIE